MELGKLHVFCHHLSENAVVFYFFVSHQSPPTNASLELELYGMGLSSVQFTVGFLRPELCLAHMHCRGSLGEGMNKG